MAKKKHQSKKHRFKYAEPTGVTATAAAATPTATAEVGQSTTSTKTASVAAPAAAPASVVAGRDFSYLPGDLRRLAAFGVSLVIIQLILWWLFAHTGLGPAIDGLVKV